ncbi:MAG: hypothetical protein QXL96_12585 [Ignisphaera sp.]
MMNLKIIKSLALTLIVVMVITSLGLGFTEVQAQAPKVVKFEIDKTSVYMGYQGVEIKAYIYAPSRPTITLARATLIAGLQIVVNLSLVELAEPTTITIGNITYNIRYIVLGRVMIPHAVYPGVATLRVEVSGRVGADAFSNTTTYRITILSSRFVEEERMDVYRLLERVNTVVSIASALGVDTTNAIKTLGDIEAMIKEADSRLLTLGEVDEANEIYKNAKHKIDEVYSLVMLGLSSVSRELSRKLDSVINNVDSLSATVAEQINKLDGVVDYTNKLSLALAQYSSTTNDAIKSLSDYVSKLAKQQEDSSKNINNVLNEISNSIQSLNNKVDSMAKNHNDVVNALNSLQLAVTVMGVAVIVAIALMGLRFRK